MTETSIFGLHVLTVLGAVFILIGTLLMHIGNQIKSGFLQTKIDSLAQKNEILSDKLTNTSIELNKAIVGDGYAVFGLVGIKGKKQYYGSLQSNSEYNIYDISILVTDFDKLNECKTKNVSGQLLIDHDCFWKCTSEDKIAGLPSGSNIFPKYSITTKEKRKHLEIKITTRSNRTVQQSVFELSDNPCIQSYRLYQFDGKNWILIKEKNQLNLNDEYWEQHFLSIENRKITNL